MKWLKLITDITLSIVMIPFILIGLGLFIGVGMVHFTMWMIKRRRGGRRRAGKKQLTINRDIKISLKNDFPPQPPAKNKFVKFNNY
jgi:hypothetical protein